MTTSARGGVGQAVVLLLGTSLITALAVGQVNQAAAGPSAALVSARSEFAPAAAKVHPVLLARLAEREPVKAWVFFTDKGGDAAQRTAAIQSLWQTYDQRAVERRVLRGEAAKRGGAVFDERDLPVAAEYLQAVQTTGAKVHVTSRWLNAASVLLTRAQADRIAALDCVDHLQPVARGQRLGPPVPDPIAPPGQDGGLALDSLDYGISYDQLQQMNLPALHTAGYTGAGVIIGILDTGFHRTHQAFHYPGHELQVVAEWDFVDNDPNTEYEAGDDQGQHYHGSTILGTLAAYRPGELVGGAFDASFILCKTEDTLGEYPAEEDNYVAGLEFIEAHGGDMATSSLGYIDWYTQQDLDGQTAVTTVAVNAATANGLHCCTAAGNEYHDSNPATSHLIAPADAYQVVTCGAVDWSGYIADFSSDGPTADGRCKPELLARGVDTYSIWPYDDYNYSSASGTSLSTPLIAGVVGCLIQAYPQWTPDQMRSALFHAAGDYVQYGTFDPLYVRGYGIVNAYNTLPDCNGNGIPDVIEIRDGLATDFNGNGVPDRCEGLGDLNCDVAFDAADIDPFFLALADPALYEATFPGCDLLHGDINGDGSVDAGDIDVFFDYLGAAAF